MLSQRLATRTLALLAGLALGSLCGELVLRLAELPQRGRRFAIEHRGGQAYLVARDAATPSLEPVPAHAAGTIRIGVFGASTAFGLPYPRPHRIWTWVERELEARNPGLDVAFHNLARPGIALRQIVDVLREVPPGFLDQVVCLAGHNEFLLEHVATLRTHPAPPGWLLALERWRTWNTVELLCRLHRSQRPYAPRTAESPRDTFAVDGDAFVVRERIVTRAQAHLTTLVALCRARGLPLTFVLPAGNVWRFAPAFSSTRNGAPPEAVAWLRSHLDRAHSLQREGRFEELLALAEEGCRRTPDFAAWHGFRARALGYLDRWDEARRAMRRAEELDLRPTWLAEPLRSALLATLREGNVSHLDLDATFARTHPIERRDALFADHCHPSIAGQRAIANALAEHWRARDWFGARATWSGRYVPTPAEEEEAQRAERSGREIALHLALLATLSGLPHHESVQELEAGYATWRAESAAPPWQAVLGHGMTLALLDRDDEAEPAIREALALDAGAGKLLRGLARGSPRVATLLDRLGITVE